jgi:hypothetical protein
LSTRKPREGAEAERQRAEREAAKPSYTLDDLERMRSELAAQIAERETHLRVTEEQELLRHRAARLHAEIDAEKAKLAALVAEHAVLLVRLA